MPRKGGEGEGMLARKNEGDIRRVDDYGVKAKPIEAEDNIHRCRKVRKDIQGGEVKRGRAGRNIEGDGREDGKEG